MKTDRNNLPIYTKRGKLRKIKQDGTIDKRGNLDRPNLHGKTVCFRLSLDIEQYAIHTISEKGVTMSEYLNELIREDFKRYLNHE